MGRWRIICALLVPGHAVACGDDAGPSLTAGQTGPSPGGPASTTAGDGVASEDGDAAGTTAGDSDEGESGRDGDDSTSGAGSGGSSSDGDGDSSGTGGAAGPNVTFTEVAASAGIDAVHGTLMSSPDCLVDQLGPGTGGFCIAERMAGASAVGDFDDDGLVDLFYARTYGHDLLYRNLGDGTFEDVAFDVGVISGEGSNGAVFVDVDNDGDQDLYVTRIGALRYELYINEGGVFTEEALLRGASLKSDIQHSPTGVAAGDYDLDGYVDLYVAEWKTEAGLSKEASHSRLLRNLGEAAPGHFEDVTDTAGVNVDGVAELVGSQAGTYAFAPNFADLDGDNLPDLTIVSDFRCSRLFWNNGDGTFVDGTVTSGTGIDRNGMGSTMGDFDGDGDLDWFVTSITQPDGEPENRFFRYVGERHFVEMASGLGVGAGGWGWGTSFADVDNDADLDLMMTAGYYYTSYLQDRNQLWLNEGSGHYTDDVAPMVGLSSAADGQGRGLNAFDYDGDGDVDVFVVNNNGTPQLFRNDTEHAGDWLQIRAVGTTSNRDGLGAKVTVTPVAGGPSMYREIGTTTHFLGHPGRELHLGVGWGDDPIAEVSVYFPASGVQHVLTDVPRNGRIVVTE